MDQATVLKLLQNQGAPPTPENINRVMQQSGRGTELLGRSLGLQGGMDESGPGADLMLDKLMAASSNPAQLSNNAPIRPDSMSDGAAQNGSARGSAAIRNPPMPSRQQGYGNTDNVIQLPEQKITAGAAPYYGSEGDISGVNANSTGGPAEAPGSLGWLMALLGVSAADTKGTPPIPNANLQIEGANPNQKRIGYEPKLAGPNPQLTDASGSKFESGAPIPPNQVAGSPAAPQTPGDIERMKAEVAAENAALESANKAPASVKSKQTGTQATIEAVKNFQKMFRK